MNKQLLMTIDKEFVVEENSRKIRMIGSTSTADRVGDIMNLDPSCVNLKHYMMNPVILENHDYHKPAIAKCVGIEFKDNQMIFDIEFADTERGNEYLYLYKNGYQSASSIGFVGTEYEPATNEKGERTGGLYFKKWSLLELSLVTVPCNPEAITSAKEFISEELYRELVIEEENDTIGSNTVINGDSMTINKSDMQSILKALEIADRIISKSEEGQAEADDSDDTSNEDDTESDDNADTQSETQKPTEDDTEDDTDEEIEVSESEIMAEVIKQLLKGE